MGSVVLFFCFFFFPFVFRVPVSCCRVVSKTIGITVRLAGRNGGPRYRGAKCALACEMEGWVVGNGGCHEGIGRRRQRNTEGQGGNGGGVQSRAYRVAAKPTVMLATGIGCCGPQVVLVCTSKGQAVNMKTQLIFPPSIQSFAPSTRLFSLALRRSFSLLPTRGTSKVLPNL